MLPLILIILDGWGIASKNKGNAITLAKTPALDYLKNNYPSTELFAHGLHVGLPAYQDGNSEAGHLNLGAGRTVNQESVRISKEIKNKVFFQNPALLKVIEQVKKEKSKLHLMGLLSGVMSPHSAPDHLIALLNLARQHKIKEVYLHLFTDGRDSAPKESLKFLAKLEKQLKPNEKIATIMGRFYGMDRKEAWQRTELAYNAIIMGEGILTNDWRQTIKASHAKNETDEFIVPHVFTDSKNNILPRLSDNDGLIFFNFRSDRARQISKAIAQNDFEKINPNSFKRKKVLKNLAFAALTDFSKDIPHILTAYTGSSVKNTLPFVLKDLKQLYIAEKEKYAHVTYFFNGGYADTVSGEDRKIIPSPKVEKYDETPAMSSFELTEIILKNLKSKGFLKKQKWQYDFTVLNFAAPDMVGHTGNLQAGIQTCEAIDECVDRIAEAYLKIRGTVIITADHGNIEEMITLKTGEINTKHSINKVPFILVNSQFKKDGKQKIKLRKDGKIGDVAPTILDLLKIKKPEEMGESLIDL